MVVNEIDVFELKKLLDTDKLPVIVDVREPYEHEFVNIGGKLIPLSQLETRLEELSEKKNETIIVYCRSGARSAEACRIMMRAGFKDPINLKGGIIDWAQKIDPSKPVY